MSSLSSASIPSSVSSSSASAPQFAHSAQSQGVSLPDEVAFELLHSELVGQVLEKTDPEERERALSNLELIGFNAGYRLIEKLTRESPKFKDELDLMKFVCKDFWTCVFRKQIDNLRTNHQGVYVLQDNRFKFLAKVSESRQYLESAPKFVIFSCGLVRGSLANLGVNSIVTAEISSQLPSVKFQVQVQRS